MASHLLVAPDEYVDVQALQEASRLGERLVDLQIQARHQILERADGMLRLGIAEIGGMAAVAGFLVTSDQLTIDSGVGVFGGVVMAILGAIATLLAAAGGRRRREIGLGPNPEDLLLVVDEGLDAAAVYQSTIRNNHDTFRQNAALLARIDRRVDRGAYLLILGALIFLAGLALIPGGHILV